MHDYLIQVPYDEYLKAVSAAELAKEQMANTALLKDIALIGGIVILIVVIICMSSYFHAKLDVANVGADETGDLPDGQDASRDR